MKEDITIIDNYHKLMLGDHRQILNICKDESLEEIDKQVRIISILAGKSEDEILHLPIPEYKALVAKSRFLQEPMPDTSRIASKYNIGKFELVPVKDYRKITTAQYIDFQSFHQAGMEDHIVEILSCLLVPDGTYVDAEGRTRRYSYNEGYDIFEVQNAIRDNLSVADGLSLYAFFLISSQDLIKDMLTYSRKEAKRLKDKTKREEILKQIEQQEELLRINGVG